MKVLCILQNAWGTGSLPMIFEPNPNNKSAKTIRTKVLQPEDTMHFANTTATVTSTAAGKAAADPMHLTKVMLRTASYYLIIVCGKQAKEALDQLGITKGANGFNIIYMPHPASRTLSNAMLAAVKAEVDKYRKS